MCCVCVWWGRGAAPLGSLNAAARCWMRLCLRSLAEQSSDLRFQRSLKYSAVAREAGGGGRSAERPYDSKGEGAGAASTGYTIRARRQIAHGSTISPSQDNEAHAIRSRDSTRRATPRHACQLTARVCVDSNFTRAVPMPLLHALQRTLATHRLYYTSCAVGNYWP